jgi:hypothetical protein
MRILILTTILILVAGCATTAGYEAILNTWLGENSDHLVSVWGPPDSEYALRDGGKVLMYAHARTIMLPGFTTYQAQTTYTSGTVSAMGTGGYAQGTYNGTSTTYVPQTTAPTPIEMSCTTRFSTDASGRIVNWAWQGNACKGRAPKQEAQPKVIPAPYKKCSAEQIRTGECN